MIVPLDLTIYVNVNPTHHQLIVNPNNDGSVKVPLIVLDYMILGLAPVVSPALPWRCHHKLYVNAIFRGDAELTRNLPICSQLPEFSNYPSNSRLKPASHLL
jgi:hypothetical protein